jgi:hypothetical protein
MNWLAQIEQHVTLGGILLVCGILLRNHKIIIRAKDRLNDLWWDRCTQRRELYTPLENGQSPVMPPDNH